MLPDNAGYYHAAYIASVAIYALYAVNLWRRRARVRSLARQVRDGAEDRARHAGTGG